MEIEMIWNQERDYGFAIVGYTDDDVLLAVEYRQGGWYYDDINPDTGEVETLPCSEIRARRLLSCAD